ncbi:MAG: MBL fold metallo-hydrolase [Acidobacteria bacterium]|nr:MAG: MBL fold metallo-hydrolase [Acidobacteriota bacterium]
MKPAVFAVIAALTVVSARAQGNLDAVKIRLTPAAGVVHMAEGIDGFGGGNVAVSAGTDGLLLLDDMYAGMAEKLQASLKTLSPLPVRIVLNTHFHGDHIQADTIFGKTATIIAHENVLKRMTASGKPLPFPMVTFDDRLTIRFNGENVHIRHLPNGHTDGDAIVFFETSKVLHLGDMYFVGMFPAVYAEGGGDIKQLIVNLDRVLAEYPADAKVIPGHGDLSTMTALRGYVTMLKETVSATERGIASGKTAEAIERDPAIQKYAKLGDGGAQTVPQYVAMLVKLLKG